MKEMTAFLIVFTLITLWNLVVIGGCAYAVFVLGHSPLWFILAVLLLVGL